MPRTRRSADLNLFVSPHLDRPFQVDSALFSTGTVDFPYVAFAPLHYEPGYAYPLIVWLHGRGSDERQLPRVMPLVSMRNYVAVAPRGILVPNAGEPGRESFDWLQTEEHLVQAEQRVFDSLDVAVRTYNISSRAHFPGWIR